MDRIAIAAGPPDWLVQASCSRCDKQFVLVGVILFDRCHMDKAKPGKASLSTLILLMISHDIRPELAELTDPYVY
jgi:hypothetical protein